MVVFHVVLKCHTLLVNLHVSYFASMENKGITKKRIPPHYDFQRELELASLGSERNFPHSWLNDNSRK